MYCCWNLVEWYYSFSFEFAAHTTGNGATVCHMRSVRLDLWSLIGGTEIVSESRTTSKRYGLHFFCKCRRDTDFIGLDPALQIHQQQPKGHRVASSSLASWLATLTLLKTHISCQSAFWKSSGQHRFAPRSTDFIQVASLSLSLATFAAKTGLRNTLSTYSASWARRSGSQPYRARDPFMEDVPELEKPNMAEPRHRSLILLSRHPPSPPLSNKIYPVSQPPNFLMIELADPSPFQTISHH